METYFGSIIINESGIQYQNLLKQSLLLITKLYFKQDVFINYMRQHSQISISFFSNKKLFLQIFLCYSQYIFSFYLQQFAFKLAGSKKKISIQKYAQKYLKLNYLQQELLLKKLNQTCFQIKIVKFLLGFYEIKIKLNFATHRNNGWNCFQLQQQVGNALNQIMKQLMLILSFIIIIQLFINANLIVYNAQILAHNGVATMMQMLQNHHKKCTKLQNILIKILIGVWIVHDLVQHVHLKQIIKHDNLLIYNLN
ncbi:unnamed protein product [Paramecium pentaurelia]|uniref:Transmembrane protein n=1 Tax=Paramecium pentaurelia TaxID=43138 RepID=A0A8S1X2P0_9CILI|nr:unnamed protein product [Paramecium pentaurelia]